jgi:ribonucleoside-diphosphate reductase subunit M2
MILSFFSPGDGLISENIILRFLLECDSYQQQAMFIVQLYIELVHAETYGLTIFTIIPEKDRKEVFEACNHLSCVAAKAKFMEKYMYSDADRCIRLAAFAIAEGIFFSMLFSIIFWFRSQGKLATLISSNEQISKDEGLHRDFGCMLFKKYGGERFKDQVLQMVQEALKIESDFVDEMLPEPIGDLNKEDIKTYGTIVADNLLVEMGFQKFWNRSHPENLKWMNDISLPQKNNFYEIMVASYNQFSSKDIEGRLKIGKNETAETEGTTKKEEEEIDF